MRQTHCHHHTNDTGLLLRYTAQQHHKPKHLLLLTLVTQASWQLAAASLVKRATSHTKQPTHHCAPHTPHAVHSSCAVIHHTASHNMSYLML
jgi:hypothetical protein